MSEADAKLALANAEIDRLKSDLETARRQTVRPVPVATRIQVVEVLQDGVVLKGPDGKTVIAPSGAAVVAEGSRVREGSR